MKNRFALPIALMTIAPASWAADAPAPTATIDAARVAAVTAPPAVPAVSTGAATRLVSPRTGMSYTVTNLGNRTIIFQTEALAPVTAQNVTRIVATNPALSPQSQQTAVENLLKLANLSASASAVPPAVSMPAVTDPTVVPQPAATQMGQPSVQFQGQPQ